VIIPNQRDMAGFRFGFVWFLEVSNVAKLALHLDKIIIEGRKICVNLPRFGWDLGCSPCLDGAHD